MICNDPPTHECVAQVYQHHFLRFQLNQEQKRWSTAWNLKYNIHLSISIFIDSTQLKIQFLRHAASMNKTSIAGLVNVLQVIL